MSEMDDGKWTSLSVGRPITGTESESVRAATLKALPHVIVELYMVPIAPHLRASLCVSVAASLISQTISKFTTLTEAQKHAMAEKVTVATGRLIKEAMDLQPATDESAVRK